MSNYINQVNFPDIFFLFIILTLLGTCHKGYSQNTLQRITVEGNEFKDESHNIIVFRGMSISDPDKLKADKKWNKKHFEEAKNWGANIIRFPIHPPAWIRRGEKEYLQLLDDGIKWAEELGMYVIIDWHSIGNLRTELFMRDIYNTTLKQTYEFWRLIAGRYGNNTTVAFYEIFNEPTLMNNQLGTCSWEQWKGINEEIITIIRANGGKGIPLVAGFNWAYDLTEIKDNPIDAEGIGYVSHPYPQKREKPWKEKWINDWGYVKEKYPLILTEIGFCGPEDPGAHIPVISDESYGDAITDFSDERNISYIVWVFDGEWSPSLYRGKNYTPSRHGKYFKKKFKSYNE